MWDLNCRCLSTLPDDGCVLSQCGTFYFHLLSLARQSTYHFQCLRSIASFHFDPTVDDSDSGWVHRAGAGSYQLRVGRFPASIEPLVSLRPDLNNAQYRVQLYEAHGGDPEVPEGKLFARLTPSDLVQQVEGPLKEDSVTYVLNAQSLDALAFRVDVVSVVDGSLLARGLVPFQALAPLEGFLTVGLLSPGDLCYVGTFRANFIVVSELRHPLNILHGLQRSRWMPNGTPTLDIGHRGSGASRVRGHSVRENTLLSFQKAALNHSDFIEFDVHLTADGEVVVHHDFEVRLAVGKEEVRVALPTLRSEQLRSPTFARHMVTPAEHRYKPAIDGELSKLNLSLKRTMTSGEDFFRSIFNKQKMAGANFVDDGDSSSPRRTFLADRIALLEEAFKSTPDWLGFNIEVKYPTDAEMAAMGARFLGRNQFIDAVLGVVLQQCGTERRIIFSTFDPDCATLLSLKQPRYPVFFLTCGGTKTFKDPRMNSLDAALSFALESRLQGVVAEASSILRSLEETVERFHCQGLFLFTWGDVNNEMENYLRQKNAGVDAIIMDDIARIAKATAKTGPAILFTARQLKSPSTVTELQQEANCEVQLRELDQLVALKIAS